MKLSCYKKLREQAMTLAELSVATGIGIAVLAAFTAASVALQRSFVAIEDYSKGLNDQMRISDYLALDMRRAFTIELPPKVAAGSVRLTIPNFYPTSSNNVVVPSYDPQVVSVPGWPYKKHHHNKHQSIILGQVVQYGPLNGTAPTMTVVYTFNQAASRLYRCVNGAVPSTIPGAPDPTGVTTIATDVSDFNVTVNDLDETATTQIKFKPRFRSMGANPNYNTDSGIVGTTYFQTTLTRNTR